jgi:hypothetical protein
MIAYLLPVIAFLVACSTVAPQVDMPLVTPVKITAPIKPVLQSALLTPNSTPTAVEKAHVTDLGALVNYSDSLAELIAASE